MRLPLHWASKLPRFFVAGPLLLLFLLAACGGTQQAVAPAPPGDPDMESERRLARFALREGQTAQAVVLYERLLARAFARDEVRLIGDVGYEYSLALLRDNAPRLAAEQALRIRLELERRGVPVFAELFLVEAVARYEAGDASLARAAAKAGIEHALPDDGATPARAHFILGMLAADAKDAAAVEQALSAMGTPVQEALRADKEELHGRWLMLTGQAESAALAFGAAAAVRQDLRDYRGMARAMAGGAAARETAGNPVAAADLYYRAGRSAAVQDDLVRARTWLNRALKLAVQNGLGTVEGESRDQLRALDE